MGRQIKTYFVSREFWQDQPETAARLVSERTAKHPDDLWLIAIGERSEVSAFLDNLLFMYGSPEYIDDPDPA